MKQALVKNSKIERALRKERRALADPTLPPSQLREVVVKALHCVVFGLGLLLIVPAAHAQSSTVSAHVPFDFIVGEQVYSAGNYMLSPEGMITSSILIRNTDDGKAGLVLTQSCENLHRAAKTVLIFHRYSDQYFLEQVWVEGNTRGRQFPKSPIERKLLALNHQADDEVIVAALVTH